MPLHRVKKLGEHRSNITSEFMRAEIETFEQMAKKTGQKLAYRAKYLRKC